MLREPQIDASQASGYAFGSPGEALGAPEASSGGDPFEKSGFRLRVSINSAYPLGAKAGADSDPGVPVAPQTPFSGLFFF